MTRLSGSEKLFEINSQVYHLPGKPSLNSRAVFHVISIKVARCSDDPRKRSEGTANDIGCLKIRLRWLA